MNFNTMTEKAIRQYFVNTAIKYLNVTTGSSTHKSLVDYYNKNVAPIVTGKHKGITLSVNSYWCAMFVSVIGKMCGLDRIIYFDCGCISMLDKYKPIGGWVENDAYIPNIGDLVLYDWDDNGYGDCNIGNDADHIGIVVKVNEKEGWFKAIEGNMGAEPTKVGYRTMKINGRFIRGFIIPDFKSMTKKITTSKPAKSKFPDICYAIRVNNSWSKEYKNNVEAGADQKKITDVMVRMSDGSEIKYRVHVKGGVWLPWVTGYNKYDFKHGYAGNGKPIDALEIKCKKHDIRYQVSGIESKSYYSEVKDVTTSGSESYAGVFGHSIDKIKLRVV